MIVIDEDTKKAHKASQVVTAGLTVPIVAVVL